VEAARASGASAPRILLRHIVPNCIGTITVNATLAVAAAVGVEAALSFLGFGIQPPQNSWGRMLSDAEAVRDLDVEVLLDLLPRLDAVPDDPRGELPRRRAARRLRAAVHTLMADPVLTVRPSVGRLHDRRRARPRGRRRQLRPRARRDARHRRRVGIGKDRPPRWHCSGCCKDGRDQGRGAVRRREPARARREAAAADARQSDRDDLPGRADGAEPRAPRRRSDR